MNTLLWSWQHIEAVCSMQLSAELVRQEATEWSVSGRIRQLDVWAVCGGLKAVVGAVARGRTGFGSFPSPQHNKAQCEERRQLIQGEEVRAVTDETRRSTMAGMRQQGKWTRWENAIERRLTWTDICRAEPQSRHF